MIICKPDVYKRQGEWQWSVTLDGFVSNETNRNPTAFLLSLIHILYTCPLPMLVKCGNLMNHRTSVACISCLLYTSASPSWTLDTEKGLILRNIHVCFPKAEIYRYVIEVSEDNERWSTCLLYTSRCV